MEERGEGGREEGRKSVREKAIKIQKKRKREVEGIYKREREIEWEGERERGKVNTFENSLQNI